LILKAGDGDRTRDVQLGKMRVTETYIPPEIDTFPSKSESIHVSLE